MHGPATRRSLLIAAFRRLRPEEGLLVVAFIASAVLTVYANIDLYHHQIDSRRIRGGLLRLAIVMGLAALVPWLSRTVRRRKGPRMWLATAEFVRMVLPFVMCIAVYTNLHDTVRYVNRHDVHAYLSAIEEWIFGGQPVLWAEAYVTPARTEFFNFFYANFYLLAPSVVLTLWFRGRVREARSVLLGVIVCFYCGYVLYVLLPAAPPRIYYASLGLFHVTLHGGPITQFQDGLIAMMPNHAERAAFPSLHAAVGCVCLYLLVEILPADLSNPARVRRRPAHIHGLPAAPLGSGPDRRRLSRTGRRVAGAEVRAVVDGGRQWRDERPRVESTHRDPRDFGRRPIYGRPGRDTAGRSAESLVNRRRPPRRAVCIPWRSVAALRAHETRRRTGGDS